jgi:hypothetical protein
MTELHEHQDKRGVTKEEHFVGSQSKPTQNWCCQFFHTDEYTKET